MVSIGDIRITGKTDAILTFVIFIAYKSNMGLIERRIG
jgi:hypothetical protein